jgi:hypothetical protein
MVIARTTTSTLLSVNEGMRWAAVMTRSSYLVSSPKMASASALTMSMSKPSILPFRGFREPSR